MESLNFCRPPGKTTNCHINQKWLAFRLRVDYATSIRDTELHAMRGNSGKGKPSGATPGTRRHVDKKVVEIVIQRAAGYCEVCGKVPQESMALHHRKLKSRGGKDTPANLIWIHHGCHNLNTDSIHLNPKKAELNGWMVGSWQDPEEAPFVMADKSIVLLKDDGTIHLLEEGRQ